MAIILDNIICTITVFLLTFAWVYYTLHSTEIAFTLATIVALCSSYVIGQALKKHFGSQQKRKAYKQLRADLLTYLRFNTDNGKLIAQMVHYYDFVVTSQTTDCVVATKNDQTAYFATSFAGECVKANAIIPTVVSAKRNDADKLYLLCNKADSTALTLAQSQLITEVIDIDNLCKLLEQADLLPNLPTTPKARSVIGSYALCKARAKTYFGCGIFLLLTSFISYAKFYNVIWASVLCAIGVYCLFNKKYNVMPTTITLN